MEGFVLWMKTTCPSVSAGPGLLAQPVMTVSRLFLYLFAHLSSYHDKAIKALYELA